jgi:hypothetical protein
MDLEVVWNDNSLFFRLCNIRTRVTCGFGGMQLKIEMNPKIVKIKIDFLIHSSNSND